VWVHGDGSWGGGLLEEGHFRRFCGGELVWGIPRRGGEEREGKRCGEARKDIPMGYEFENLNFSR
jgi:hypothetical protein